jgi:hypothetical protein
MRVCVCVCVCLCVCVCVCVCVYTVNRKTVQRGNCVKTLRIVVGTLKTWKEKGVPSIEIKQKLFMEKYTRGRIYVFQSLLFLQGGGWGCLYSELQKK